MTFNDAIRFVAGLIAGLCALAVLFGIEIAVEPIHFMAHYFSEPSSLDPSRLQNPFLSSILLIRATGLIQAFLGVFGVLIFGLIAIYPKKSMDFIETVTEEIFK